MMDVDLKKEYVEFIKKQLSEMAKKVKKNSAKNQEKRENNIFLIFSDKNAKKYMGTGRSFDSQLGNRLQNIAFFAARKKYGEESVPNIITLFEEKDSICVSLLSYSHNNGMSQKVYWTDVKVEDLLNKTIRKLFDEGSSTVVKTTFKIRSNKETIDKIKNEFHERDKKKNGIPIDLFILETTENKEYIAHSYEIKAGGNLDTKNAPSNAKEVISLETIFSFCNSSFSKFATCYDGKGDKTPDGAIGNHLNRNQILIGEEFWKEVLEQDVSYDDFINIYKEAYALAKVEEIIIG